MEKNVSTIKKVVDELHAADRYNQVVAILFRIMNDESLTGIFDTRSDQRKIDSKDIIKEAGELFDALEGANKCPQEELKGSLDNLTWYVDDMTTTMCHNYTIRLSHRRALDIDLLDDIRCWLILDNLLLSNPFEEHSNWTIPNTWKKF